MKKGHFFFKNFVKKTRLKVIISKNIASFAQISPKQALKYIIFFTIQKRPKMAKNGQIAK
jgi:hypothetical protein